MVEILSYNIVIIAADFQTTPIGAVFKTFGVRQSLLTHCAEAKTSGGLRSKLLSLRSISVANTPNSSWKNQKL
ncbi:hypothetical protein FJZ31_00515 [Candidatus Poribacteria bacterium]|nr:hypothetical protein [Candidatus Poribacteria bacterium]